MFRTLFRTRLRDTNLVTSLNNYACIGPVRGEMTTENPYVGDNAVVGGQCDDSSNIVAWAAAGALKNLALSPEARPMIEPFIECLCRLAHSPDWLEENKGQGALHHLRQSDPCWFQDDNSPNGKLCVDHVFNDQEGETCRVYGNALEPECLATNKEGIVAKKACCACAGGNQEESWSMTSKKQLEL